MVLYETSEMRPENTFLYTSFKIYKIDESEHEPYVSKYAETCEHIEDTTKGYHYEHGKLDDTIKIRDIINASWDFDYSDWSGTCTVKIPYKKKYLEYIHKGAYVEFRCARFPYGVDPEELSQVDDKRWKEEGKKVEQLVKEYTALHKNDDSLNFTKVFYKNMWWLIPRSFRGYITDIKYNPDSLEVTCNDYPIILEEQAKLSFKQMYRSDILYEVIHASGMTPNIDMTGLPDEVIDWSNISSNNTESTSSEGSAGDALTGDDCTSTNSMACLSGCNSGNKYGSGHNFDECCKKGYAVAGTDYYNWARKFSSGEEMLKALRKIWEYYTPLYYANRTCPQKLFNTTHFKSNCYDAARMVKVLCDSIGYPCVIVTGYAYGYGHGWNVIKTGGQWLSYDLCFTAHANSSNSTNMSMLF